MTIPLISRIGVRRVPAGSAPATAPARAHPQHPILRRLHAVLERVAAAITAAHDTRVPF